MISKPEHRTAEPLSDQVELYPTNLEEHAGELTGTGEEIDLRVQRAQEKLLLLRQQQEFIERQKRELEEISRRQDELDQNRAALRDLLGRSIVQIEREVFENEQRIETLRQSREILAAHLVRVDAIDPKSWEPSNIRTMLSQALAEVETARSDFERVRARLTALVGEPASLPVADEDGPISDGGFLNILKKGLAFTLPLLLSALLIAGLLAAILLRLPVPLSPSSPPVP